MENGKIKDSQITASFVKNETYTKPWSGRLNNPAGFWSAPRKVGGWLQIDFRQKMAVAKVATQGRPGKGHLWVTSYKISYSKDEVVWNVFKENGQEKVRANTI